VKAKDLIDSLPRADAWIPSFSLRRIAVSVVAPSLIFGRGEGTILPVIPLRPLERIGA